MAAYPSTVSGIVAVESSNPSDAFIISTMPKPLTSTPKVTATTTEYGKFVNLLDKLLVVPHSKIKAELDAEKQKKRTRRKRADVGHAFRDSD